MHVTLTNSDEITMSDTPIAAFGWNDGHTFYPREIRTLSDGHIALNDHVTVLVGPPEAFDFESFDRMVSDPPHYASDKPCFACKQRWRGRILDHLTDCAFLARIDHLDRD